MFSTGGNDRIKYADGMALDAFSRVRTSTPTNLFDSLLTYGSSDIHWQQVLTGAATVTDLLNSSAASLNVTNASGDSVVRQTKTYWRYQPGKSQLILMTGVLGLGVINCRRRMGYFDVNNGLFFQLDGTILSVVQRSSTSGSPIDTVVTQGNWNLDKLDGTGSSSAILDITKDQIFVIDLQWLGAGRVRFGFNIGGMIFYCHQFLNSNILPLPYMGTATLPVRYEIANTGATTGSNSLIQVCVSVVSEGGMEAISGFNYTASTGISFVTVTTRRPIISISPKTTFNGVINRTRIVTISADILAGTNAAFWELVYNPVLTGATFTSVGATSLTNFDTNANALSGGTILASGFIPAAGKNTTSGTGPLDARLIDQVPFTLDITGLVPDILTIAATSTTGTTTIGASFNWEEQR